MGLFVSERKLQTFRIGEAYHLDNTSYDACLLLNYILIKSYKQHKMEKNPKM